MLQFVFAVLAVSIDQAFSAPLMVSDGQNPLDPMGYFSQWSAQIDPNQAWFNPGAMESAGEAYTAWLTDVTQLNKVAGEASVKYWQAMARAYGDYFGKFWGNGVDCNQVPVVIAARPAGSLSRPTGPSGTVVPASPTSPTRPAGTLVTAGSTTTIRPSGGPSNPTRPALPSPLSYPEVSEMPPKPQFPTNLTPLR